MKLFYLFIFLLFYWQVNAQQLPLKNNFQTYSFVNKTTNRINYTTSLDSFFAKLHTVKTTGSGKVKIVQIGDSHLQPNINTSIVKNDLQNFFGNGGRGLIFPYRQARTNGPQDYNSTSNFKWQNSRVVFPVSGLQAGIAGYVLQTTANVASLNFSFKNQSFTKLRLFTGTDSTSWTVRVANNSFPYLIIKEKSDSLYTDIQLDNAASSFTIYSPTNEVKRFYGAYVENDNAGIIYNTIGVNGAKYSDYNYSPLFWQQLPALDADLYIISLGTNEAQKELDGNFINEVETFLAKLKAINPNAGIIITTPSDSYLRKKSFNYNMQQVRTILYKYCFDNNIAFWDLYSITGGFSSAKSWARHGLMNADKVHYTVAGYVLQGNLFYTAFARAYNDFLERKK